MADFSSLKQTIQTYVKQNGNEEITGNILQDVLLAIVTTMGDGAINGLASALQEEANERQNQDATLQGNINTLGGRIDTLQNAINGINTKLAEGYIYAGIAIPSTNPGTPSGKVFYIALQAGTYTNFSSLTVTQGISILKYNGTVWSLDVLVGIDDVPVYGSKKLVWSGGVKTAINDVNKYMANNSFKLEKTNASFESFLSSGKTTSDSDWANKFYMNYVSGLVFLSKIHATITILLYDINSEPVIKTELQTCIVESGINYLMLNERVKINEGQFVGIRVPTGCVYYKNTGGVGIVGYDGWEISYWVFDQVCSGGIGSYTENLISTSVLVDNKWIDPAGGILNNNTTKYRKFDVEGLSVVSIYYPHYHSEQFSPINLGAIRFENQDSELVSVLDYSTVKAADGDGEYWYINNIIIPLTAKYLCINVKLGSVNDTDTIVCQQGTIIDRGNDVMSLSEYNIGDKFARINISDIYSQLNKFKSFLPYDWTAKKWVPVGDSLTEKNYRAVKNYYDFIKEQTGVNLDVRGQSGNGWAAGDYVYSVFGSLNQSNFDFVTVFGSGNDCYGESVLPDITDWATKLGNVTDNGTYSICGYINRAIDKFYQTCPLRKIGIITPTPWASDAVSGQLYGTRMDDYSNKIVEICKRRGIPCLDLYHCSGLIPWNESFRIEYYNENGVQDTGVHPNSKGHKWISNMFMQFIMQFLIS